MNRLASIFLLLILFSTNIIGQSIFPQKIEGCNLSQFCLDCGEPKAGYDLESFTKITNALNSKYNFAGIKGKIGFQVLVDSSGKGCVLSHTDRSSNHMTKDIINYLNDCKWVSAKDKGKPVNASINVFFDISNETLSGQIQRINHEALSENLKNPGTPHVYNKNYEYKNQLLNTYEVTVWQRGKSLLPNDMSTTSAADNSGNIWYATYNGFVKFDGSQIVRLDESNSPFNKNESINAIGVDKENNKWISAKKVIYKFNNTSWEKFDSTRIGIAGAYSIVGSNDGEVFFCSDKGLLIYKDDNWELINTEKIKQLPSNRILYAYRDGQRRLWIGTFSGSIMIDVNKDIIEFSKTNSPLAKTCISGATEDENGNVYFSLYAYEPNKERNKPQEGFAVLTKENEWSHYNDTNSGLPANHINSILYDKFDKVLWIGTNEAGLARFDLKKGWENYHNLNSKVPSSYIFDLSQDSKGNIYASTFYGMMRISKK